MRAWVVFVVAVVCWLAPVAASAQPSSEVPTAPGAPTGVQPDEDVTAPPAVGRRTSTADALRATLMMALVLGAGWYFFRQTSGGATRGYGVAGWSTYYLVWLVVPLVVAIVTAYPAVLIVIVVAIVARPWLPDPIQYLRHARRTSVLEAQVRTNPTNSVARRELAMIWIDKRRPARALPHLAAARAREPDDLELVLLEGQAEALAGRHQAAAATFQRVIDRAAKFRYGEAWLAQADALIACRQWEPAEAALRGVLAANSSSVEALVKRARVRTARGDRDGARDDRRAARALYRELPRFQRRRQRWWYVRAVVGW